MSGSDQIFERVLLNSIEEGLGKVFDQTTAKAVQFYVDGMIAVMDPDAYARSLQKMFGDGAKVLITNMMESLSKVAGIENREWSSFSECVRTAREGYHRKVPSTGAK